MEDPQMRPDHLSNVIRFSYFSSTGREEASDMVEEDMHCHICSDRYDIINDILVIL